MTTPKRMYETPAVKTEQFQLGVYGDYGLDTEPFMPVTPPGTDGRRLGMD